MGKLVISIEPGSLSEESGITVGSKISAINGNFDFDIIDYMQACADKAVRLLIDGKGEIIITNTFDRPLGIGFEEATISPVKHCINKCVFCFVDQMPKGLRESLYVKDDDYRLSFLYGNYITLTNSNDKDIDRIIKHKLSPLYVSVHSTNPELRAKLIGLRFKDDIIGKIKRLCEGGIRLNLQFVLCPGLNDAEELKQSFESLMPFVRCIDSVACVPVGLASRREGLFKLRRFTKSEAAKVIDIADLFRKRAQRLCGRHVFAASDEFYIVSGKRLPNLEYYEQLHQYEDGVGIASSFLNEARRAEENAYKFNFHGLHAIIATGALAFPIIDKVAKNIEKRSTGLRLKTIKVENLLFGNGVTVAGLISGHSLAKALAEYPQSAVVIPSCMLSEEELFLDGYTVEQLEKETNKKIAVASFDGNDFLEKLLWLSRGRHD